MNEDLSSCTGKKIPSGHNHCYLGHFYTLPAPKDL